MLLSCLLDERSRTQDAALLLAVLDERLQLRLRGRRACGVVR